MSASYRQPRPPLVNSFRILLIYSGITADMAAWFLISLLNYGNTYPDDRHAVAIEFFIGVSRISRLVCSFSWHGWYINLLPLAVVSLRRSFSNSSLSVLQQFYSELSEWSILYCTTFNLPNQRSSSTRLRCSTFADRSPKAPCDGFEPGITRSFRSYFYFNHFSRN